MKKIFGLVLTGMILIVSNAMVNVYTMNEIVYSSNRPLTWTDFKGKPDDSSPHEAWTWSGISYSYSWTMSERGTVFLDYSVYAYFDMNQSWIKKGKQTDELLRHEQVHFDITELHARYFRAKLVDFEFTKNADAEVDSIYKTIDQSKANMVVQYDKETEHSRNKSKQNRWGSFVKGELDKFADYAMELE